MKSAVTVSFVFAAFGAFADFAIDIDPKAVPIKDMSRTTCNSGIGYNAALEAVFGVKDDDWWFISNRVESARVLREAGANLLRLQCMNGWFARQGPNPYDPNSTDKKERRRYQSYRRSNPKAAFDFYKANGIKVFVCLECRTTNAVPENVAIVKWIVDNGYKDCVAGIEMGNETYGNPRYPEFAPLWSEFIDRVWEFWPKVPIGMNIGELFENNPDLVHLKNRILSDENFKRDWRNRETYFTAGNLNRHSAQFVLAMSNKLDRISHIIYHAYGADTPYSCSYYGFKRFRNFTEMFPVLKGKKYWLTEVRPRSDEDNWCQRMFREALIMGHYSLMALCQPETDCFCHHQLTGLSGAIHQSNGTSWHVQWYDGTRENIEDDLSPCNQMRMEASHIGVAYRILGQGIRHHPYFLQHGLSRPTADADDEWTASAKLADQVYAHRRAVKEGKADVPPVAGEVEWVVATTKRRDRFCLLMVNSKPTAETVTVTVRGCELAAPTYRTVSCPEEYLDCRAVPGEGRFWSTVAWEDSQFGYSFCNMEKYNGLVPAATTMKVRIKPHTIQTVQFVTRKLQKGGEKAH